MGSSAAFHDSDVVIQQVILDAVTNLNGQKVGVFVWDEGPLNYNVRIVPSYAVIIFTFQGIDFSPLPSTSQAFCWIIFFLSGGRCTRATHLSRSARVLHFGH